MHFRSTLTETNKKEFIKSWASSYQTGLLTLHQKRDTGDVGVLRPVLLYPLALVVGYLLIAWGMQIGESDFMGIEILFSVAVLFFIAFNLAYAIRPKWFSMIAKSRIYPKRDLDVTLNEEGIFFRETPNDSSTETSNVAKEGTLWHWWEIVKVVSFARTLVIYNLDCKSFNHCKGHVLLINKDQLNEQQREQLQNEFIAPLKLENKFRTYYSYSDILIFLVMCILIALVSLPFYL